MAKKTRKVLKQESQQRARQQAVANMTAAEAAAVTVTPSAPSAPARVAKIEVTDEQDFTFVRSDVRRSLTLAGIFAAAMIALSFVLR